MAKNKTSSKKSKKLGSVRTIIRKNKKIVTSRLPKVKKIDEKHPKLHDFSMENFKFPSLEEMNPGFKDESKSKKKRIWDIFKRKK